MTVQFNDKFNSLPEALQQEVMQFIESLLQKNKNRKSIEKENDHPTGGKKPPSKLSKPELMKPIRKKFDPAYLKALQGWKGHNEAAIEEAIHEMNVEEPIEDLLAMLSK